MLEFPYMQTAGGIARPIIAVGIEGPSGKRLLDGLLDTGSDPTVFPQDEALALGIALPAPINGTIKTAGGVLIAYRLAEAILELRGAAVSVRWKTLIAFAEGPLSLIHLGTRGFLEHFHCTFFGPEKKILLTPCASLPRV
jgi:hypothetical protein